MTPDVSVIIAVYNTATYLPDTLASLERQTLGFERIQVILVDDGSTDGSDTIIDDFAVAHPANTIAIHQPNSGTPASPFNRGLDRATGRWVFFLGSDDYLDDDALQVLVENGDAWESDVIFGRVEAEGGHKKVPVAIYRAGRVEDMDLYTSRLPYNLSNSKLFRRRLIEDLGLRYREDMRQRCDQPFTLTAYVHARRISMIGNGAVYRARARDDRSNVTYTADAAEAYRSTAIIVDTIADLLPPGERRDHLMQRMFDNTMRGDLRDHLAERDEEERAFVFDQIAHHADRFLTDRIFSNMKVQHRAVIAAALARDTDTILALLHATEESDEPVGLYAESGRAWFTYPGFDPEGNRDAYEITRERPTVRVSRLFSPATVEFVDSRIRIRGNALVHGDPTYEGRIVRAGASPGRTARSTTAPTRGRRIDAEIQTADGTYTLAFDPSSLSSRVFRPSIALLVAGTWYDVPLQFTGPDRPLRAGRFRRAIGTARADEDGHLVLDLT